MRINKIIGIDPGNRISAMLCLRIEPISIRSTLMGDNHLVLHELDCLLKIGETLVSIERVGHYGTGMPVGKEVFETVEWIGRFEQVAQPNEVWKVSRKTVAAHICASARAKDSNIRQALIDRFGPPGTKKCPGFTYGVKSHLWSALAVAAYTLDNLKHL